MEVDDYDAPGMIGRIAKAIMTPAFMRATGHNAETIAGLCAHVVIAELGIRRLEYSYVVATPYDRPAMSPFAQIAMSESIRRNARQLISKEVESLVEVRRAHFAGPAERASLWVIQHQKGAPNG